MDNATKLFRKSAFGFNREDVVNYIEKTKNDFYDYKIQTQRTIDDLNEKIKELEEALKSKSECIVDKTASDDIDFSSSVSQINEAADHLRETADKICDDIGDFLDKVLTTSRDTNSDDLFIGDKIDVDLILNEEFTEEVCEGEISEEAKNNEDLISSEENPFSSQFSQIIDNAVINKDTVPSVDDKTEVKSASILDGLLGSSIFSA